MTIGSQLPFRETLTVDREQLRTTPRVSFAVGISSAATAENPALMCIPNASCLLALQISCVSFAFESLVKTTDIDAKSLSELDALEANLCLRLTDDCGRPQGPFLPVAAFGKLCTHMSTYHVPLTTHVTIPLPRAKRVAWCLKTSSALDSRFGIACTIAGSALVTSLTEAADSRLGHALSKMIKNSGVDSSAVQLTFGNDSSSHLAATTDNSKRLRDVVDDESRLSRKRTSSFSGQSSESLKSSESAPELIHAFVRGGPDES